jgi:putative transposase
MKRNSHPCGLRLPSYDYTAPGGYFVTLCTDKRASLFGNIADGTMKLSDLGLIIQKVWLEIPLHFKQVSLDEFIVMPNHLHGILHLNQIVEATHASPLQGDGHSRKTLASGSLGAIIGSFKAAAAKHINSLYAFSNKSIWQRNYYEHIIRNELSLEKIQEYICNNPLRWHLDRENPHRDGLDEFYTWLDQQGKNLRDIKKNIK